MHRLAARALNVSLVTLAAAARATGLPATDPDSDTACSDAMAIIKRFPTTTAAPLDIAAIRATFELP
jgi:hypothetical protein